MGRFLGPVAVAVVMLATASGSHGAAVEDCGEGGSPPQPAAGTVDFNPQPPVVNHRTVITASFNDRRPYVEGSMRVEIQQPDGTKLSYAADSETFTPTQVGEHVATVTAKYYGCVDRSTGETRYVTDTAGPTRFTIGAGKDPTMFIKAIVRRASGRGHGSAFLQANMECGDSTVAAGTPVTFTFYYETGGRLPTHSSHHVSATNAHGCQGRSSKDTFGRPLRSQRFTGNASQVNVLYPQRMRVLIELTRDGRVLGASRASFKPSAKGETVVRDSGSCAGAPKGCQRFKTTFI